MTKKVNKKQPTKKLKKLKKGHVIKLCISLFIILVLTISAVFAYGIYQETAAFDSQKLLSGEASKIYDKDGKLVYTYGSDDNGSRKNVKYEDLPQVLIDAVVAAEDSRFFEHDGFDLPRIVKATLGNLAAGHITSGGSTITQQVVKKSYFPNATKTYTRKISEVLLAIQADKELSKEEIITLYLNKIYFGRSTKSIGIAAASKYYFNKDVSQLTLPEAALLAGSLNAPYTYDPYYNLDKASARRNTILNLMVNHGYITKEEADDAKKVTVQNMLDDSNNQSSNAGYLAAYVDMVTKEVKKKTNYDPTQTQMNIHTYLQTDTQQTAFDLNNGVTYKYSDEDMQMAGCVSESQTGRIVAVLGGRNYQTGFTNWATTKQQPGSSVKPFLDYGLAIEYLDWCSEHTVDDTPWDGNRKFKPKNWDGNFHGKMNISSALENSWNVPAVRTFEEVQDKVGDEKITEAIESLGISMKGETVGPAYAIGGWSGGISPVEMCSAYGTIANNGKYTEQHTVNYAEVVATKEKFNIDKDIKKEAKQSALSEATAFIIRQIQLGYTKNGVGNYRYLTGLDQICGKTGTSNFSGSSYVRDGKSKDLWMTAYNPDYVCSVWMGFTKDGIHKGKNTSDYSATPGLVVQKLMKQLTKKGIKKEFPKQPDTAVQAEIVIGVYPYKSPTTNTPASKRVTAWFKKGTTPNGEAGATVDPELNDITSFDASLDSNGTIQVTFGAYNPIEATTNAEYNADTQMYGVVVYTVVVTDAASGNTLHTQNFNSNTGTVNYTVNSEVKVTGYYSYADAPGITSKSKISKTLGSNDLTSINGTVTANGNPVNSGAHINATSIDVNITKASASNTCSITLSSNGSTIHKVDSNSTGFSGLSHGQTYKISMSESNGSKTVHKEIIFTVQ